MLIWGGLLACSPTDTQSFEYGGRDRQNSGSAAQNLEENSSQDTGVADEDDYSDGASDVGGDDEGDEVAAVVPDNELCGTRPVGADIGDCAENFSLPNQTGGLTSLHDFEGSVVFLDLSSFT